MPILTSEEREAIEALASLPSNGSIYFEHVPRLLEAYSAMEKRVGELERDVTKYSDRAHNYHAQLEGCGVRASKAEAERDALSARLEAMEKELDRITRDRDAKAARMWELGKECDALSARCAGLEKLLAEASEYIHDIPESAVGGDDSAALLAKRLRAALEAK